MNKKHIRGSLTNQHVNNQDPKLKTADHFIVGVSPMARSASVVDVIKPQGRGCGFNKLFNALFVSMGVQDE